MENAVDYNHPGTDLKTDEVMKSVLGQLDRLYQEVPGVIQLPRNEFMSFEKQERLIKPFEELTVSEKKELVAWHQNNRSEVRQSDDKPVTVVPGTVNAELEKMASIERRTEIANAQHPLAVIIACSDSRVPPELLFDKGLGEIFVVRVAGNIVGPLELGSVEYAVEHLGAKLVMVLGHERCGAVTATYDAYVSRSKIEGYIGSIVESINPAVKAAWMYRLPWIRCI